MPDLPQNDRDIIRRLAERKAEIAALPCQQETIRGWKNVNDLKPNRPMVWINELPWHELNINDELTLQCESDAARGIEMGLRKQLYQWDHMRCDMVITNEYPCRLAISDTGFGIDQIAEYRREEEGGVAAQGYTGQITSLDDVQKIKDPVITHNEAATEERFQFLKDLLGDILEVKKVGLQHQWFAPWDNLIRWYGVENAMMDLAMNPDLVHAAMDRLTSAYLARLDQQIEQNLLSPNTTVLRIGSGGAAFTDDLPPEDFDADNVRPLDQWGCGVAQIFSEVSPQMHEEFALQYEMRWMERFGLLYYGCCEPLDIKVDILRQVPRLRKISMSPWVDLERAADKVGTDYVLSRKPNPAIFARDTFNPALAEQELREALDAFRGLHVEVIMKDVSTCRHDPERVWAWCDLARRVVEDYA